MPDFTIEIYWQCAESNSAEIGGYLQLGLFDERHYPSCTCPAYKYGKRTEMFGRVLYPKFCKHIIEAQDTICGWHQFYSDEIMENEGICPKCGGRAEAVQVAV